MTSLWTVFWYALLTAVATGFGALPFFFIKTISPRFAGLSNALAAGLMLGASIQLVWDGWTFSPLRTLIGVAVGLIFIYGIHIIMEARGGGFDPADLVKANARKMIMIIAIMTVHSFAEGVSIGFAFGATAQFGILIALALAVHNIPEGLAISAVLCPKGVSPWKAAAWSVFTSLPQPLMAVPAFLFVNTFQSFLPVGLGFAAGAMIWLVMSELIPESREQTGDMSWLVVVIAATAGMLGFGMLL